MATPIRCHWLTYMKLRASKTLTSERSACSSKKYDDMAYQFGKNTSARFIGNIEPRFGDVTPMPKSFTSPKPDNCLDGQCAALARAMATAMAQGKEQVLIKNMYTAAAFALDPASRDFVAKLSKIQSKTGEPKCLPRRTAHPPGFHSKTWSGSCPIRRFRNH